MSAPLLPNEQQSTFIEADAPPPAYESRFAFLQRIRQERLSNLRPLGEFFDRNRIGFTTSFSEINKRWNYNLKYFSANYFLIMLILSLYCLFSNLWVLFTLVFILLSFLVISRLDGPISFAGVTISASSLYIGCTCMSIFLLLFSGVTGAVFWVIAVAAIIILGHAALLEPGLEGEFGDDQV